MMMEYPKKKWAEVVSIVSGKNQKNVESATGEFPIYGSGGVMGWANAYLCEAGSTIVGRKGTINKPIFVNRKFWNVDTAFGITPGFQLHPRFLFYFCQSFNFSKLDKSTTIPSLAKRDLLNIEMPVPSLAEQERIVAKIEELFSDLDNGVATLKRAKTQVAFYRQAAISSTFPKLTANTQVKLDEIAEISSGITKGRKLPGDGVISLPYLRVANVQNGYLNLDDVKEIELKAEEKERFLLHIDDILYTEGGDRDKLGRGTIWRGEIPQCVHQNHIFKARPNKQKVLPQYLAYWSMSTDARNYFYAKGKQSVNLASINKTVLSNLPVPLPTIDVQKLIVQDIESISTSCAAIERTISKALQQASSLRQSILKKAFEGELI